MTLQQLVDSLLAAGISEEDTQIAVVAYLDNLGLPISHITEIVIEGCIKRSRIRMAVCS